MIDLTQEQWREKLAQDDEAILLDVRTAEEYHSSRLEDALLLDINEPNEFVKQLKALDKNKPYYVYCRSGNRSVHACLAMDSMGFKETYNLLGGIIAWTGPVVIPENKIEIK